MKNTKKYLSMGVALVIALIATVEVSAGQRGGRGRQQSTQMTGDAQQKRQQRTARRGARMNRRQRGPKIVEGSSTPTMLELANFNTQNMTDISKLQDGLSKLARAVINGFEKTKNDIAALKSMIENNQQDIDELDEATSGDDELEIVTVE